VDTELTFITGSSLSVSYKLAVIVPTGHHCQFVVKPTVMGPPDSDIGVITVGFNYKPAMIGFMKNFITFLSDV
jgi:hypothetical protein